MPRDIHPIPFVIHPSDELAKNIDLRNLNRSLANKYADGHVVTDDDLQIMGRNLWSGLSTDVWGALETARKEAGEKILPVVIHSDAADVQSLPWETLFHPTYGFIGKNPDFTLTRRSSAQEATGGLDQGPLRVLLFTSLPDDVNPETGRLNVEEEQVQVQEALLPWIAQGLVTLEMPDDGRFSTLQNLLKEFQPHVLFLSGHGNFHHMPHANKAYGEFFFEDEAGNSVGVKDDEIADTLRGTGVQAVILSACESGKAASDELSNGLTRKISAAGIPYVVGMREAIYDIAGIQFVRALCDSLARQERMDVALQAARIAIQSPFQDVARASSPIRDELSYGQWCLPLLISSAPSRALIDWDFTPRQVEAHAVSQKINTIVMPARFIGRRTEMRKYKNSLLAGKIHRLLITGPGGQGKTSLAGKLALDMQTHGYRLFAWSARSANSWRDFELDIEQSLDRPRVDRYDKFLSRAENESARAQFMLDLLMDKFNGRVALFLDNLETIQDPHSLALKDATVEAWLRASNQAQGMILLVTSRWQIPNWDGEHEPLTHVNYGDFLQIAQRLSLPPAFLARRNSLRQVYDILGGNVRGLEFFASAVRDMENANEENAFLEKLSTVKEDLQANMAIEVIYNRLPTYAKTLLHRLPAFHEPVPMEGLLKLALDLPNPESMLQHLLAVSLLEASYEPNQGTTEYQCLQMVTDWMNENGLIDNRLEWLNAVADYHLYVYENGHNTLGQAITTHRALKRTERQVEAARLALNSIVVSLRLAGHYTTLLYEWLQPICNLADLQVRCNALNEIGLCYAAVGNYELSISYAGQALAIAKKINNKQSEGAALDNIGEAFRAQGNYETALVYLQQSLDICKQINNKLGEGAVLSNIGLIYDAQMKYETALAYFKQSLEIQEKTDDKKGEGRTLNNIATVYQVQGDFETALAYLKQSLDITRQIGDKVGEGAVLANIGALYRDQGMGDMAFAYLKQSLKIQKKIGDIAGEGATLCDIAIVYKGQEDYETALVYLNQSLEIQRQIGDKAGEGWTLKNIVQVLKSQGKYETIFAYLKHLLEIQMQFRDKPGEGATLCDIATVFQKQGDYETTLAYLKQSLEINQQIGNKEGEGRIFNHMAIACIKQDDYETALAYLKRALEIQEEISDKGGAVRNLF
jgi:tetratricopeptide (TPR) repeat protein